MIIIQRKIPVFALACALALPGLVRAQPPAPHASAWAAKNLRGNLQKRPAPPSDHKTTTYEFIVVNAKSYRVVNDPYTQILYLADIFGDGKGIVSAWGDVDEAAGTIKVKALDAKVDGTSLELWKTAKDADGLDDKKVAKVLKKGAKYQVIGQKSVWHDSKPTSEDDEADPYSHTLTQVKLEDGSIYWTSIFNDGDAILGKVAAAASPGVTGALHHP